MHACKVQKLPAPARKTIALRTASRDPQKTIRSREGREGARDLQGVGGVPPSITAPMEQVQIDHTVVDLIVVDERDRQPIGRPHLIIAKDLFTRCVSGMVVTLEAPSAVSGGLCLAHVVCDKRPWLERMRVEMDWPMSGKPRPLYLDNATGFKSEALRRGCEQHEIRLDYRPPGQPHFGGIRAGLASARARGRKGGRPCKMTTAKLRLTMAAMGKPETRVGDLCKELGITLQTSYRHLSQAGELRPEGKKLLNQP